MNQLEAFTTLVDAARQMPETKHLNRAIKVLEKLIERRRAKRERRAEGIVKMLAAFDDYNGVYERAKAQTN